MTYDNPTEFEEVPGIAAALGGGDDEPPFAMEDYVAQIVQHMRRERVPASAAVDALTEANVFATLDEDVTLAVLRIGWITLANNAEHAERTQRQQRVEGTSGLDVSRPVGVSPRDLLAHCAILEQSMMGVDGAYKPLLDFSADDWLGLASTCTAQATSFARRAALAEETAALLAERKATSVRNLPKKVRDTIAAKAEVAWRGFAA